MFDSMISHSSSLVSALDSLEARVVDLREIFVHKLGVSKLFSDVDGPSHKEHEVDACNRSLEAFRAALDGNLEDREQVVAKEPALMEETGHYAVIIVLPKFIPPATQVSKASCSPDSVQYTSQHSES